MTLVSTVLAVLGLVVSFLVLAMVAILSRKIVHLEERIAWLEGQPPWEIEGSRKPEPEIPEIMKAGATQPPGSA